MPNRWRALRSIQLKRWNHWVRNVMRHHLNYVQWTQIKGILLSTSHPPCSPSPFLAFHFPLAFPFASILCAVCTVEWSLGRCKANACSCLAAVGCECEKANAKSAQCVGKGEGRGEAERRGNCGSVTGTRSPSAGSVWITIYVKLPI